MLLPPAFDEAEILGHFRCKARAIVSSDWKAAALFGTVQRKSRHDQQASGSNSARERATVRRTLIWLSQEMKYCTVMPEVIKAFG